MDPTYDARPGQSLADHLDGVAEKADILVAETLETPCGNSLSELISTVAHLHDFGKLTTYFQDYIDEDSHRQPNELEKHSRVGAIVTLHALSEQGFCLQECVAGFFAVQKHHGTIPNVSTALKDWKKEDAWFKHLREQLEDIDDNASESADDRIRKASGHELSWDEDDIVISNPKRYRKSVRNFKPDETFYPLLVRVWSTLTCADKIDAAGDVDLTTEILRPNYDAISFDNDTDDKIQDRLNRYRTEARENVSSRLATAEPPNEVFRITLPTGFGKTAAGLEAGLRLAAERDSRVIYALPYTTVVNQVDGVIQDQFKVSPLGKKYTIHHHLADTRTRPDGDESVSDGTEVLYGESWQVGLVLTTFVQLFESVAGPGNLQSIKLPALQDSVIIVDEPQGLPNNWWHLLSRLSTILTEEYNATLVLMTATQPRFIEEYNPELDPTELVPNVDEYFDFLAENPRVMFKIHESVLGEIHSTGGDPITPAQAGEEIIKERISASEQGAENTLVVNNTVTSAVAVGAAVTRELETAGSVLDLNAQWDAFSTERPASVVEIAEENQSPFSIATAFLDWLDTDATKADAAVLTLTAALRPVDRGVLIEAMRKIVDSGKETRLDDLPLVVSATQLVEAGVDVSVDQVYRDFAPLPSIVQAAGRCNRSFDGDTGAVTIWMIEEDGDRPSGIYTSNRDRLEPARSALRTTLDPDETAISEATMISTAVDRYYAALYDSDQTSDDYDTLASAVDDARGDTLREASLVEDHSEDALVITTDQEMATFETYLRRRESGEYQGAKEAFGTLKHLLASAQEERIEGIETTESVLAELGYEDVTLWEFDVIDVRTSGVYDLRGLGVRE